MLGEKIKEEISKRGLKQGFVAKSIGMSPGSLTHIVCGNRIAKPGQLRALEKFLGLENGYFPDPIDTWERSRLALAAFGSIPIPEGADVGALVRSSDLANQSVRTWLRNRTSMNYAFMIKRLEDHEAELRKWR